MKNKRTERSGAGAGNGGFEFPSLVQLCSFFLLLSFRLLLVRFFVVCSFQLDQDDRSIETTTV